MTIGFSIVYISDYHHHQHFKGLNYKSVLASLSHIANYLILLSGGGGGTGSGGASGGGGGGGGGSDSDDTSENSTAGGCTPLTSSETVLSSRSPRPSKYNFYVELGKKLGSR